MSLKALKRHLLPLMPYLQTEGVTEICINRPQEIFVEADGVFDRYEINELDYDFMYSLATLVAEANHISFPAAMVSGSLPGGERVQFVLPPACEVGKVVCSIRKQRIRRLTLDDYEAQGAFDNVATQRQVNNIDEELMMLYEQHKIKEVITLAVKSRKNILISGGTGTGKTTFLNSCLSLVPETERIITIEDVRETVTTQPNSANLLFNGNEEELKAVNIFKSCLRLRPDRIFLSELRGKEVWAFLRAINSGHPGSMSTIHADSSRAVFMQLVFMMQQIGSILDTCQLYKYISSSVDVVIQLQHAGSKNYSTNIREIWLKNMQVEVG